jgi:hypothetical protein
VIELGTNRLRIVCMNAVFGLPCRYPTLPKVRYVVLCHLGRAIQAPPDRRVPPSITRVPPAASTNPVFRATGRRPRK